MSGHCGTVTEDGNAVCVPSTSGEGCSCASQSQAVQEKGLSPHRAEKTSLWRKIRSGLMFGVACVASPCCTPIALALLASTPVAVWVAGHMGWVYGGLTVLSAISLVLGFRWLNRKTEFGKSIEATRVLTKAKRAQET